MTKNKLLNSAIIFCKFFQFIYILVILISTVVFIHVQIDPEAYSKLDFMNMLSNSTYENITRWKSLGAGDDSEIYVLNKITTGSLYILYFQLISLGVLCFLAVKEFQNVIKSVKNFQPFKEANVRSFRKIGIYLFVYFIVSSFTLINFENGGYSVFSFSFTPLLIMILAFVFAEIFKEGYTLKQENDLTI